MEERNGRSWGTDVAHVRRGEWVSLREVDVCLISLKDPHVSFTGAPTVTAPPDGQADSKHSDSHHWRNDSGNESVHLPMWRC